ncbi:MAG: methyltransferase domain-containing protein [Sedimentisphaerales bacterium]
MTDTIFKIDLSQVLKKSPVRIEIGCGQTRREGTIGIDRVDLPSVDIVTDIENGLSFLPDNSVDEIYSSSCFEHINNFVSLMKEIIRVLKPGGKATIFVPHFSNPYFYSDPTHVRTFGLYTFYYFVDSKYQLKRKVPAFYFDFKIKIISQKFIFGAPFPLRGLFLKCVGVLFNLNMFMQELYEGCFSHIFPCHGMEVIFTPDK